MLRRMKLEVLLLLLPWLITQRSAVVRTRMRRPVPPDLLVLHRLHLLHLKTRLVLPRSLVRLVVEELLRLEDLMAEDVGPAVVRLILQLALLSWL
jgi:hypothetical protein